MSSSRPAEPLLVERARTGDPDAWEEIYRDVYPRLYAYARRRLATTEQAEEAVSETMLRAMGKIGAYTPGPAGLTGWLFGISRNVVLETYRARARLVPADPGAMQDSVDEHVPDPAEALLEREDRRQMARAFANLSESDQDVLELRVVVGLDADQVGAMTDRRPGAVRTAQSRALQRLRGHYEGQTSEGAT